MLGPHGATRVRVLLPGAQGVEVIQTKTATAAINQLQPLQGGLFEGRIDPAQPYLLTIDWGGGTQTTEDPYSFGPLLSDFDLYLLGEGRHLDMASCLGAQVMTVDGVPGVRFAVWAPNARRVSVVGNFNSWDGRRHPMRLRQGCGVWELFIPRLGAGAAYKYEILGPDGAGAAKGRPGGPAAGAGARHRLDRRRGDPAAGRPPLRRSQPPGLDSAAGDLRGACRLLAAAP